MLNLSILKKSYTILLATGLGIVFALVLPSWVSYIKPVGDIFISLLKMLVVPIVLFAIIASMAKLGESSSVKYLSVFILGSFVVLSTASGILGTLFAIIFNIGGSFNPEVLEKLISQNTTPVSENFKFVSAIDFIKALIPINPFAAIASGNVLQVLVFAILIGLSLAYINNPFKNKVIAGVDVINDVLINIVNAIMYITPFGVFSLISYLVYSLGIEVFYGTLKLIMLVIIALVVWVYVVLGVVVVLFTNVTYIDYIKKILGLQIMAFSTASSIASLPASFKTCESLKLNKNLYSLILPLGAVMNMNGSSLFYCISVIFTAQIFNIDLSMATIIAIIFVATLGSIATPGIPGLSLTIIMVMVVANVPLVALPIIIAIDRVLDMFVTAANVTGDTVVAAIVSKYYK